MKLLKATIYNILAFAAVGVLLFAVVGFVGLSVYGVIVGLVSPLPIILGLLLGSLPFFTEIDYRLLGGKVLRVRVGSFWFTIIDEPAKLERIERRAKAGETYTRPAFHIGEGD